MYWKPSRSQERVGKKLDGKDCGRSWRLSSIEPYKRE
jgi:hypothetical protein